MKEFIINNFISILVIATFVGLVLYLMVNRKWEQLRAMAYWLILQAEKVITGTKRGQERFEAVFEQLYSLVPAWLRFFFPETLVREKLQEWFNHLKDYLSDGKLDGEEGNTSPII